MPPRHILLLPVGSAGDVFPFIWLGRKLKARGHRVTMLTACLFEDAARGAGLDFVPLGTREEFEAIQRDPRLWQTYAGTRLVFEFAGQHIARGRDAVLQLAQKEPPALMLGSILAFGGRLAATRLRVPFVTVHLQPAAIISMHDTPVFFSAAPWLARLPLWMKRLIFSLPNPADQAALPWLRRACAEDGLPPPRGILKDWWHSPDGVLMLFPEWFAAPQPDWPANYFQHAFPLEDLAQEQPLPDQLRRFLDEGAPPVLFTPGSANVQARAFFRAALDAVTRTGQRAVFITRDLSQLPAGLPANVCAAEYVPFSAVLPRAAAFVHHGGIGTLSQGLAAGVPQLLMPMAHDQPDNENRLRRLGAGFGLGPRRFTGQRVADALSRLCSDPAFTTAARRCAEKIKSAPSADAMLGWIEERAAK